jgi:serine/threonine-protein kinase
VVQDEPLASPVSPGEIVADKYRVERVLGVGGMGVVVSARHTTLDQVVAIKFLVANRFGSREEAVGRFLAEARAAARIESDYVCRVFDVGTLPNGIPFMVMEHLEGRDLDDEVLKRGQLDLVEAVDYVLQAADALAAAHQLGIVHRDIKPANLFLAIRPDGTRRVKVLDFGISKVHGRETTTEPRHTLDKSSLGTPAYMSPEQVRAAADVDARTDIWGLGAILYELVTGQMAFVGSDVKEILDHVLKDAPCPMSKLRRDVPPELEGIVMRCLERDRNRRWTTAATFARALAPYGSLGIFTQLASVQRELGSLTSISAVRVAAAHSVQPMVANIRPSVPTMPDPLEVRARESIVDEWTKLRARKRQARVAVLGLATVAALVAATALLVRFAPPDAAKTDAPANAAAPPPAESALLPGAASPAHLPSPSPAPSGASAGAAPSPPSNASALAKRSPPAQNVQAAPNSVHSARTSTPRSTGGARSTARPAPKGSVNHLLDTRD